MKKSYIPRETTDILKGVALILMFVHHLFTFPRWYVDGISYPELSEFAVKMQTPTEICVGIFAFLTGYFYAFRKPSFGYSLKKATDVWITYFVTYILMLIPAVALSVYNIENMRLESFGMNRYLMYFCWYVNFYIVSILLLPLYARLADKHFLWAYLAGIVLPVVLVNVVDKTVIPQQDYLEIVDSLEWFPLIAVGFIFARYEIFEKVFDAIFKNTVKYKVVRVLLYVSLLIFPFFANQILPQFEFIYVVNADILYAPLLIYGIVNLVNLIPFKKLFIPLQWIGKYSLLMWFIHCVFFNVLKPYTQWFLYLPKHPVLVVLWGLLICLIPAVILNFPLKYLLKGKNFLFDKVGNGIHALFSKKGEKV